MPRVEYFINQILEDVETAVISLNTIDCHNQSNLDK